jgi:superfamily II DNA/RNA helicase
LYGGVDIKPQSDELRSGVDFVVGTPGRLIDCFERGSLLFTDLEIVVLDEADQMLTFGF